MRRMTGGVAIALALSASITSAASSSRAIAVTDAWSRPTPNGLPTGVVYLSIANRGPAPDRLTGGSTPVAARMDLHRSSMRGGIMSMDAVPGGLPIAPGAVIRVAPGGYHFMLVGLKHGLSAGQRFPATLSFARTGPVRIEVQVRNGPPEMTMR